MRRLILSTAFAVTAIAAFAAQPKNVILFIGDGMSTPQRMTAEEFSRKSGRGPLALNNLPFQATTRTCSANSLVTDSAAAATAIACGEKTRNGSLGVDANGKKVYSSAAFAKQQGKKVGVITSVTINHATPGGFYAHRKSRGDGYGIGLDLLSSGFDLFAGDELTKHNDCKHAEYRGDIYALAETEAGYKFINDDTVAFLNLKPGCGKVWFVSSSYPFAIDVSEKTKSPSLAQMTAKGIELLDNPDRGFFMMVEGGKIDWAGHANDAATNLREMLALDDAVKVALDFQKRNPDTLIVVTGDHETGGMSMGFAGTGYNFYMEKLVGQKRSMARTEAVIKERKIVEFAELRRYVEENFVFDFTDDDWKQMEKAFAKDVENTKKGIRENEKYDAVKVSQFPNVLKQIVSHKCGIGWSSGAHTALPVLTTAAGPGADVFHGFIDNTDISKKLISLMK